MMKVPSELTQTQLDILREVSHAGMGHAATALSQFLGHPITLAVSRVSILPLADILGQISGEEEELVAAVNFRIRGDAEGNILILLPQKSVISVIHILTGKRVAQIAILSEEEKSVLKEMANILASAYLTSLTDLLEILLVPSIPRLALDMARPVVDDFLNHQGKMRTVAMIVEAQFESPENELSGRILFLPDPESVPTFFHRLPPDP